MNAQGDDRNTERRPRAEAIPVDFKGRRCWQVYIDGRRYGPVYDERAEAEALAREIVPVFERNERIGAEGARYAREMAPFQTFVAATVSPPPMSSAADTDNRRFMGGIFRRLWEDEQVKPPMSSADDTP